MIYTAKIPIGWRGDGIISYIGYRDDLAAFIAKSGLPAVEISNVRSDIQLPRVEGDSDEIGRLAAEHFLERRYRHFAWAPMTDDALNSELCAGFSKWLDRAGFSCHMLPPLDTRYRDPKERDCAAQRKLMIQTLIGLPKPLAVFCYNDCVAADVIDACDDASLLVPESVAVLGTDNDALICESILVPLSSVCHDLEGMAYQAAALLDRLMSGLKPPKKMLRVPPLGLVTRRSTDILAVGNLQVARALRCIHDNYSKPLLGVDDIVLATNLSRRALEKAFRHELSRSLNEEVVRVRLEQAKNLLATTELSVGEISTAAGFSQPNHLFRTFRRFLNCSPRVYRTRQRAKQLKQK
jgi:LacI family transcriptional regulator